MRQRIGWLPSTGGSPTRICSAAAESVFPSSVKASGPGTTSRIPCVVKAPVMRKSRTSSWPRPTSTVGTCSERSASPVAPISRTATNR